MKKVLRQIGIAAVSLGVGFGAGWWSNTQFSSNTIDTIAVKSINPSVPDWFNPDNSTAHTPPTSEASEEKPQKENKRRLGSFEQRFRQLLNQQAFDDAMDLYDEVESISEAQAALLRQIVLEQLRGYLEDDRNEELMALIDIYLSKHYDDTGAILILAQYQWRQGYFDESARVFQLAFTYAYQPVQRESINKAFKTLVIKTDNYLDERERWIELLGFYELLDTIDLIQPQHQIRQAQLYQLTGDSESATRILLSLLDNNEWGEKAQAMLTGMQPQQKDEVASTGIPLQQIGNHYLINVELNEKSNVVLMIDTGASVTSLTEKTFSRLSERQYFTQVGSRLFNTANGVTKGNVYRAEQLTLGDYDLSSVDLAVLDFQQAEGIDGLLGMNVLQHFRFEIDQDQQQLILQPR